MGKKGRMAAVFSIGSASWQASRNLTLKSVCPETGRERSRAFPLVAPRALSCSCLRFTGAIPLLSGRALSHSTPDTQFRVGSCPSWPYARTPVQSDYHYAFKATSKISISNLKDNELPLVVATGNRFTERRCINAEFLKKAQIRLLYWKDRFGYCAPLKLQLPFKRAPILANLRKPPAKAAFRLASYDRQSSASRTGCA